MFLIRSLKLWSLLLCCACLSNWQTMAVCSEPEVSPSATVTNETLLALIEQLGDNQFSSRQHARERLLRLGTRVRPALLESLTHADLEIRMQARSLITKIDEMAFTHQLEDFLAEQNPSQEVNLPTWPQFRELVGNDPTARRLFAEMQRHEHHLLKTYAASPAKAGNALWSRCDQIQRSRTLRPVYRETLSAGRIAALFLVYSDHRVKGRQRSAPYINAFCNQEPLRRAAYGEYQRPMQAILGSWIRGADQQTIFHALRLAMRLNLQDGLVPAERILQSYPQSPKNVLQFALLTVGKLGDSQHIPLVENLMEERARCSAHTIRGINYRTEVRDIALACSIHLAGMNPQEMGFDRLELHSETLFQTRSLGFADEDTRGAAIKKWQQLRQPQGSSSPVE